MLQGQIVLARAVPSDKCSFVCLLSDIDYNKTYKPVVSLCTDNSHFQDNRSIRPMCHCSCVINLYNSKAFIEETHYWFKDPAISKTDKGRVHSFVAPSLSKAASSVLKL